MQLRQRARRDMICLTDMSDTLITNLIDYFSNSFSTIAGQEDFNRLVIDGSVLSTPEVLEQAHASQAELQLRDGTC